MKKLMPLLSLLLIIMGCVQTGFIRPNPEEYTVNASGLFLIDSRSIIASESIINRDELMLYYSEARGSNLSNYVVRIIFNESSNLDGFNLISINGEEVYHKSGLSEQYAWLFDNGSIIVEGTYSDYGSIEFNEGVLEGLVRAYLIKLRPVNN